MPRRQVLSLSTDVGALGSPNDPKPIRRGPSFEQLSSLSSQFASKPNIGRILIVVLMPLKDLRSFGGTSTGNGTDFKGKNFAYLRARRVATVAILFVPTTKCGTTSKLCVTISTLLLYLRRLRNNSSKFGPAPSPT